MPTEEKEETSTKKKKEIWKTIEDSCKQIQKLQVVISKQQRRPGKPDGSRWNELGRGSRIQLYTYCKRNDHSEGECYTKEADIARGKNMDRENLVSTYCKKQGHNEDNVFLKQNREMREQANRGSEPGTVQILKK